MSQPGATAQNQRWSMDFMSERVAEGRWFRILTVVDQFTRECLCLVLTPSATLQAPMGAREGFTKKLRHVPALLRKTLTYDRGKEMAEHEQLA
ncbi:MAG: transposase family protein [Nitrospira sp.]|nr:MAG: transposase family protein [Nitrospira sp.]